MNQCASLVERKLNITASTKDQVRWSADWEKAIEADTNPLDVLCPVVQIINEGRLQSGLENHRRAFRALCTRQVVLTTYAMIECFAQKEFEE